VIIAESAAPSPLALAYALSNYVLGCASSAQAARAEPHTRIDEERAPTYAALEAHDSLTPEQIVKSGLMVLTGSALPPESVPWTTVTDGASPQSRSTVTASRCARRTTNEDTHQEEDRHGRDTAIR